MFLCALQQEPVELWIQRPPNSPNTAPEVHSVCRQGAHLLLHHYTTLHNHLRVSHRPENKNEERLPANISGLVFLRFSWLALNTAKPSDSSKINPWELMDVCLLSTWGLHVCLTPMSASPAVCDFQELFWIANPADGFWTRPEIQRPAKSKKVFCWEKCFSFFFLWNVMPAFTDCVVNQSRLSKWFVLFTWCVTPVAPVKFSS